MNKATIGKLVLATAIALAATPSVAGASNSHSVAINKHQLGFRMASQQARIAQGVRDGQLTASEYQRDEANLRAVAAQRAAYMNADGGVLTRSQRAALESDMNKNSERIWQTKHNRITGPDPVTTI
jgi:hypothetical protein